MVANDLVLVVHSSWDGWVRDMRLAVVIKEKFPFFVGDLLREADKYGEKAWQYISDLRYDPQTLKNLKYVSGRIPEEERNIEVPHSIYQDIASLPKKERDKAVSGYLAGTMRRADIRALKAQTNGNGASPVENVPTGLETLKNGVAEAYVTVGRLMQRGEDGPLLAAALDELIAAAMVLREVLDGRRHTS